MLSVQQLSARGCTALAVVAALASSSASTGAAVRGARATYTLDVVRLESASLGFVGLSAPFTSRAAEHPARLLVTTTFGARFRDISPSAARATHVDDVWFLTLFRTGDGGASWHAVADLPEVAPVEFHSPSDAWQAGGPFSRALFRSSDGGRSWQPVHVPIPARQRTATHLFGSPAFFAREILAPVTFVRGRAVELDVYRRTNGGRDWRRVSTLAPAGAERARCLPAPLSISFATASDWWVSADPGARPVAYVTTDAGRHWQQNAIAASGAITGCPLPQVQAVSARVAWVVLRRAHDSALYATADAGKHWHPLHPTPSR
jgi:hypothetical protein